MGKLAPLDALVYVKPVVWLLKLFVNTELTLPSVVIVMLGGRKLLAKMLDMGIQHSQKTIRKFFFIIFCFLSL